MTVCVPGSKHSGLICITLAAFLLTACAEDSGQKETTGLLLGAVAGGLLGAQFGSGTGRLLAVGAGALAGSLVGSKIGRSADKADQEEQAKAELQALEDTRTGQTVAWQNPDTGNSGSVTPTNTYQNTAGEYCREYTQTITIAGQQEEAFGTACRKPDGAWQVQS